MTGIVKEFPGVRALDGVDLDVRAGEVHCLLGQNGAGKSTLIKVLSGFHQPDEGTITWDGEEASFSTPAKAIEHGVATIYQELDLVPHLDVTENVFLGHEVSRAGFSQRGQAREQVARAAGPARPLGDLADPDRRRPVAGQPADRQHGPGAVPRHPPARPGRAVRRAGPGGGRQPLPGHPRPHRRGRRGRLHLPPARGDPPDRRPDHRAQGRPHRRHRPRRRRHPDRRPDQADDRPLDRVRLPARAPRLARDRGEPVLEVRDLGLAGVFSGRRPHRARRRDRRARRPGRRRPVRDRRDDVRRPPGHRPAPSPSTASGSGGARSPRRCAPGSAWRRRSARARGCCSTRRSTATSRCRR